MGTVSNVNVTTLAKYKVLLLLVYRHFSTLPKFI